jgi:hypothetical protein
MSLLCHFLCPFGGQNPGASKTTQKAPFTYEKWVKTGATSNVKKAGNMPDFHFLILDVGVVAPASEDYFVEAHDVAFLSFHRPPSKGNHASKVNPRQRQTAGSPHLPIKLLPQLSCARSPAVPNAFRDCATSPLLRLALFNGFGISGADNAENSAPVQT